MKKYIVFVLLGSLCSTFLYGMQWKLPQKAISCPSRMSTEGFVYFQNEFEDKAWELASLCGGCSAVLNGYARPFIVSINEIVAKHNQWMLENNKSSSDELLGGDETKVRELHDVINLRELIAVVVRVHMADLLKASGGILVDCPFFRLVKLVQHHNACARARLDPIPEEQEHFND